MEGKSRRQRQYLKHQKRHANPYYPTALGHGIHLEELVKKQMHLVRRKDMPDVQCIRLK